MDDDRIIRWCVQEDIDPLHQPGLTINFSYNYWELVYNNKRMWERHSPEDKVAIIKKLIEDPFYRSYYIKFKKDVIRNKVFM